MPSWSKTSSGSTRTSGGDPQGRPISENDVWIAAHDQPVVSRDAHFDEVPGLRRLSW